MSDGLPATVDLSGRVSLVTGATGGMGRVVAAELAHLGSTVVVVSRTAHGGDALRTEIADRVGADRVEVLTADLAVQADVRRLAAGFAERHDALHLLVSNAGAHYRQRLLGPDGVELHLAVNHLAGFLLTNSLLEHLHAGARATSTPSRVVNLVSATMGDTRQLKILPRPRPVTLNPTDLSHPARLN